VRALVRQGRIVLQVLAVKTRENVRKNEKNVRLLGNFEETRTALIDFGQAVLEVRN